MKALIGISNGRRAALIAASALGLALIASSAAAQDQAPNPNGNGEEVQVQAPRLHTESGRGLQAVPEKASISETVAYSDLDLTTRHGARVLQDRIRFAAARECRELAGMYPYAQPGSAPCYETAVDDAMVRADAAITDARMTDRYND